MRKYVIVIIVFLTLTTANAHRGKYHSLEQDISNNSVLKALKNLDEATSKMDTSVQHLNDIITN